MGRRSAQRDAGIAAPAQFHLQDVPELAEVTAAAFHEAGHGVVARRLGFQVQRTVVRPDGTGFCRVRLPAPSFLNASDWIDLYVAGAAAEAHLAGRWAWEWAASDLRNAIDLASTVRAWSSGRETALQRVSEAAAWHRRIFSEDLDLWRAVTLRAQGLSLRVPFSPARQIGGGLVLCHRQRPARR